MYKVVALGGTFDRLHAGHKAFLSYAFTIGQNVLIGITSDSFAARKIPYPKLSIQSYQIRLEELKRLLNEKGLLKRAEIVILDDVYGPLLDRDDTDVLLVSPETIAGADMVNGARIKIDLTPIKVVTIPLILAQDRKRISSTRIRTGEIDREGHVFKSIVQFDKKLPETLRQTLKKPLGTLHSYFRAGKVEGLLITVGDAVTKVHLDAGIIPDLSIVDLHIERSRVYENLSELGFPKKLIQKAVEVKNPRGWVTYELADAVLWRIKSSIKHNKPSIILVIGEEDLAGLPAILLAPLSTRVFYGQPGEGVVEIEVTEEKKEELVQMIQNTMIQ